MKKVFVLFAVSLFALLYSCGDNAQSNQPIEDASLYLTVQDASDASALVGAKATFGAAQGTTDAKGLATFKLKAGSSVLLVEKQDYATERRVVKTDDFAKSSVSVIYDQYETVRLYKTNAGVAGVLYYNDPKGKSLPMPNVPIRIDIKGSNLAVTSYSCGTTNLKGEYRCDNLPAISGGYNLSYSIYALDVQINGVNYPAQNVSSGASLLPGIVVNNGRTDYSAANIAFILLEYPQIIENAKKSEPLTLRFSEAVDVNQFKASWISVSGTLQAINIKWESCDAATNACTQLKITPVPEWINGTQISLNSSITSISNKSLSASPFNLNVLGIDLRGTKVEGVEVKNQSQAKRDTIEYGNTHAKIIWKKLAGATSYSVFVKTSDTTNFVEVASEITDSVTTVPINRINSTSYPIGGKTNKVVVQANNSSGRSLFSDEALIKVTDDGKAPTYAPSGTSIFDPCPGPFAVCQPGYFTGNCASTADANGIINFCEDGFYTNSSNFSALDPLEFEDLHDLSNVLSNIKAFDKDRVIFNGVPIKDGTILAVGRVFFSKPMVTTVLPTVQCEPVGAPACTKLKLTPKWNSDQSLNLTVTTIAGSPVAGASEIIYTISNLVGVNTKPFLANPLSTGLPPPTPINVVKIKFKTEAACGATPFPGCKGYCDTQTGKADFTTCPSQYCNSTNGLTDYTNCPTQACNNSTLGHPECGPQYCVDYGYLDYTNCKSDACNYNSDNTNCKDYCLVAEYNESKCTAYCNAPIGSGDLANCPTQYCNGINGLADYPNCTERACTNDANNALCVGYDGFCEYFPMHPTCAVTCTDASTDYDNCKLQACTNDANNTNCKSYCPLNVPICTSYCGSEAGKGTSSLNADYVNCPTQACNANYVAASCDGYCSTDLGSTDYTNCTKEACLIENTDVDACVTYCTEHTDDDEATWCE